MPFHSKEGSSIPNGEFSFSLRGIFWNQLLQEIHVLRERCEGWNDFRLGLAHTSVIEKRTDLTLNEIEQRGGWLTFPSSAEARGPHSFHSLRSEPLRRRPPPPLAHDDILWSLFGYSLIPANRKAHSADHLRARREIKSSMGSHRGVTGARPP